MAHEILPDLPPEEKKKEPAMIPAASSREKKVTLLDRLTFLIATWQYFKWTGKAISEGKKVPREWMLLGEPLGLTKIKETFEKKDVQQTKKSPSYRVVDLEQGKDIDLLTRQPLPGQ